MTAERREQWLKWLNHYTPSKFLDSFLRTSQGAESRCVHCGQAIFLDIAEGGGVADWRTSDGDYGCAESPDTCEEGTGGHEAQKG